jgi:serpin B
MQRLETRLIVWRNKMRRWWSVLLGFLCAACQPFGLGAATLVKSNHSRQAGAELTAVQAQAEQNNAFAFALYRQWDKAGNLIFSPYSISTALAMAYGGARQQTAAEMAQVVRFGEPQLFHPAMNGLDAQLTARIYDADGKRIPGMRLDVANSLWGQKDYSFQADFLDLLAEQYGAGIYTVDYRKDPEKARQAINDWVSDRTQKRISDLLPPGSVQNDTRLVLANAIYFYAPWEDAFEEDKTTPAPFYLPDGSTVEVPTMQRQGRYAYVLQDGLTVVQIPYQGGNLAMLVMMPAEGRMDAFEAGLDDQGFADLQSQLRMGEARLYLPRFEFSSAASVKQTLQALGMQVAFEDEADFSGITGAPDLKISDVIHKAFISCAEKGTEAAAATGITFVETSAMMPEEPVDLRFDRPFLFAIYDIPTGQVLFLGRVSNPAK